MDTRPYYAFESTPLVKNRSDDGSDDGLSAIMRSSDGDRSRARDIAPNFSDTFLTALGITKWERAERFLPIPVCREIPSVCSLTFCPSGK